MNPNQNNISPDPKTLAMAEEALNSALSRAAQVLTDEDLKMMEELEQKDKTGQQVKEYIISKVPNFQAILEEETIKAFKSNIP